MKQITQNFLEGEGPTLNFIKEDVDSGETYVPHAKIYA